jgi:hypothetical protein
VLRRSLLAALALATFACGPSSGEPGRDRLDGSVAPVADAAPAGSGDVRVAVEGNVSWTPADLDVDRSELIRVTASGTIAFDGETQVGPEGFGPDENDQYNAIGCADHAALIGRVDAGGGSFLVGSDQWLLAPRSGPLAFGPNDTRTVDNTGAFQLVIEPGQPAEILEMRGVTVPGNSSWIDTGVDLAPDHLIAIDADGQVDNNIPGNEVGPDGQPDSRGNQYNVLACANHMALIGKIAEGGAPFLVGRDLSRPAGASGRLFLRVNHSVPGGNTGKFSAGILVASPR